MRWRKLGSLFNAEGQYPWMQSHAANPTAEVQPDGSICVYFSTRDRLNRSHLARADFVLHPEPKLINLHPAPLIEPGPPGSFDDSGTSMGCLVRTENALYLYYVGWNLGVTVPWRNSIGLAVSYDQGKTFRKASAAPLLDRHPADPFSLSYPWIIPEPGRWRMWYGSNLGWGANERDMRHVIKYAESKDGITWDRTGAVAIPLEGADEFAIARPCVLAAAGGYQMWFSHRGDRYRIGWAESSDGIHWKRNGSAGLEVSPGSAWDSEMVTYPCVFDLKGSRYLLYNGNAYGRTGFGLAIHEP